MQKELGESNPMSVEELRRHNGPLFERMVTTARARASTVTAYKVKLKSGQFKTTPPASVGSGVTGEPVCFILTSPVPQSAQVESSLMAYVSRGEVSEGTPSDTHSVSHSVNVLWDHNRRACVSRVTGVCVCLVKWCEVRGLW